MSNKQNIIDLANAELVRIGAAVVNESGFDISLDTHGRISASDESGYYVCKNYRTLLADLKQFASNCITDNYYDGGDAHAWIGLWSLFSAE